MKTIILLPKKNKYEAPFQSIQMNLFLKTTFHTDWLPFNNEPKFPQNKHMQNQKRHIPVSTACQLHPNSMYTSPERFRDLSIEFC